MFELKNLTPIFTFFMGIILVPFIEYLKENFIRKSNIKQLRIELIDTNEDLTNNIKTMLRHMETIEGLISKDIDKINNGPIHYVPQEVKLVFLETTLLKSYRYLDKSQRKTLKILSSLVEVMNNYKDELSQLEVTNENLEKKLFLSKKYIYTGCCFSAAMQSIFESPLKGNDIPRDQETINEKLKTMGFGQYTYEDFIKKNKITIS